MFKYQPFPSSRSIRLIRFEDGPDLVCRMITVEVEKAPPYVALSYTWGSKRLSRTISVDGYDVPITANLAAAINAVYEYAREHDKFFWADSICINQADVHERSRQVSLMSTIYRSAALVLIWLGPAANDSNLAFDRMQEWKVRFDKLLKKNDNVIELAASSISPKDRRFFGSQQERALSAMGALYQREWWTRAWVVQEGTIASSERTILFCGTRNMQWTCLRVALHIAYYGIDVQSPSASRRWADYRAVAIEKFREVREYGGHVRLLYVLHLLRDFLCEDPRDKIFAGLGMSMDVDEGDIVPDYTKGYAEICLEVVRHCMSQPNGHSLDFLEGVVTRRQAPGAEYKMPSWIPDWTSAPSVCPLEKRLDPFTHWEAQKAYNACGLLPGSWSIDGERLHLRGAVISRITRVWKVCDVRIADGGLDLVESWMPQDSGKLYFNGETLIDVFNHTIVADVELRTNAKLDRDCAIDWGPAKRSKRFMSTEDRFNLGQMLDDLDRATFGRRLFQTDRGFLGLGPAAAEVGDEVCVFLGGQVLYVVRDRGDGTHEFVGECYVHGMMDGEACNKDWFKIQDFILV